ncbi:MAG: sn-glycerol-1-phosphate dehydrogenase [Ruminococcaceae bacterium]|nr:sn-glycerol-1-phosphate dehydrogenase [Oscillospiraceae bacterium]
MFLDIREFSKPCSCGRTHQIEVKKIMVEKGALQHLPELLFSCGRFRQPTIICDENTYSAAGHDVQKLFPHAACVRLNPDGLHADEHGVAQAESGMNPETDVLLAVGSGTIHDITRYCANKRRIPFVSVPTAASVDGFVSTVAAMTWHGFKKTFPAVSPICVVADSTVFSKAPARLTASGVSDLLGKYTALADWKISHLVTGEYLCDRVCSLEYRAMREVCGVLQEIRAGNEEACEKLMYALLLSGLAMQMVGNSRPASGAEHHFSHLWEMELINGPIDAYHGEKVSVGLMIAVEEYRRAREALAAGKYRWADYSGLEMGLLNREIPSAAMREELIRENTPDPLASIDKDRLKAAIPGIVQILSELPSPEEVRRLLTAAGCKTSLGEIGLDPQILEKSIRLSPYVRNRLTLMRLKKLFQFY